jgi:hypothetical protein
MEVVAEADNFLTRYSLAWEELCQWVKIDSERPVQARRGCYKNRSISAWSLDSVW